MANDVEIVIGAQDKASSVLNGLAGKVGSFSSSFAALGPVAIGVGAALAGVAAAFTAVNSAVSALVDASSKIDSLSDVALGLGESVPDLQAFQFAMEEAGNIDASQSIAALQKMQRAIGEIAGGGNTKGAEVFAKLGLDAQALSMQSPVEQFMAVKEAIAGIENVSERAAIAQQVLGKAAADLMPALLAEQEGFEASMQAANAFGLTVSEEGAAGIASMNDAIGRVYAGIEGLTNQIVVALAPVIEEVANFISSWIPPIIQFAIEYLPTIVDMMVRLAGYAYDVVKAFIQINTLDFAGAGKTLTEMKTADEWTAKVAAARERAAADAASNAEQRMAQNQAAAQFDDAAIEAEKKKQEEAAKTIEQLERKLLVAQMGEEAVAKQEQIAKATNDAERERIALLQKQVDEQTAINDAKEEGEKLAKKQAEDAAKLQADQIKQAADKALSISGAAPSVNTATESRLLSRGRADQGVDKLLKPLETAAKILEQIRAEAEQRARLESSLKLELVT